MISVASCVYQQPMRLCTQGTSAYWLEIKQKGGNEFKQILGALHTFSESLCLFKLNSYLLSQVLQI